MPGDQPRDTLSLTVEHKFAASRFERSYLQEIYDLLLHAAHKDHVEPITNGAVSPLVEPELNPAEMEHHASPRPTRCSLCSGLLRTASSTEDCRESGCRHSGARCSRRRTAGSRAMSRR